MYEREKNKNKLTPTTNLSSCLALWGFQLNIRYYYFSFFYYYYDYYFILNITSTIFIVIIFPHHHHRFGTYLRY